MKIKRMVAVLLTATLAMACFILPAYAVTNFTGADHLLSHIAYLSDVTLDGVSISTVNNAVQVNGDTVGYWYTDEPSTVYADDSKATKLINETPAGFEVDSSILRTLFTGINIGSMKVYAINKADYILISESGWLINGTTELVQFVPTQEVTDAGSDISMTGAVEVRERNFSVTVPSVLPMVADTDGNVTTATNATITNNSNAPVKIKELSVLPVNGSGWTLVDGNPSTVRGAKEFSFDTSLTQGTVIDSNSDLNFTYEAKMSPIEDNVNAIDIVTVTITLDWEE